MYSTSSTVDLFLMSNKEYLPDDKLLYIKARLEALPPERMANVMLISFKSPMLMLLVSIFLGVYGIDRFMLGDVGMGIGKLLTGGGCGLWWLIDICLIQKATKEKNFEKLAAWI